MQFRKMDRAAIAVILLLGPIGAISQEPSGAAANTSDDTTTNSLAGIEAFVDAAVGKTMAENHIAGAQVSIVKDGRVVLLKGYGIDAIAPERKVDPTRSLFRIGSISKTFTWIALMQLQERGLLELSDPINDHLPDDLKIPDEGFTQPIRVIDLMNHTAGFEDVLAGLFVDSAAQPLPLIEHLKKYRPHRVREPGKVLAYSNYGAALAGALVAHVSKTEYEQYVEANIFVPLGMSRTTMRQHYPTSSTLPAPLAGELAADKAVALEWRNDAWLPFPQEHIGGAPAGSGVSTAADIAHYMNALLNPLQLEEANVLKQSTFAQMRTASFQAAPGMPAIHHGFFNAAIGHRAIVGFDNLAHTGSTLHFFSIMIVIPDLAAPAMYREPGTSEAAVAANANTGSFGIFITTNGSRGRVLLDQLPEQVLNQYFPQAQANRLPSSEYSTGLSEYAGTYAHLRRSFTTVEKIRRLTEVSSVSATADGYLRVGAGRAGIRMIQVGKDLFRQTDGDGVVAFTRDESGRVVRMNALIGAFQLSNERLTFFRTPVWFGLIVVLSAIASLGILIVAVVRLRKQRVQSKWEALSARSMTCAAACWLAFIALFVALVMQLADPVGVDRALMAFPPLVLKASLVVVLLGTLLTVIAATTAIPALRGENWTRWRRVRHSLAAVIFIALVVTLGDLNLIGFQYY